MPVRKKTSTTKLPQTLQQQIQDSSTHDNSQNTRRSHHLSRKEARKLERETQKQKKAAYFSEAPSRKRAAADEDHNGSPLRKKPRQETVQFKPSKPVHAPQVVKTTKLEPVILDKKSSPSKKSAKSDNSSSKGSALERLLKKPPTAIPKSRVEEEEDAYIRLLEGKLGMGKSGKRKAKNPEEDDGLDDLMDWADSFLPSTSKAINISRDELEGDDYDSDEQEEEEDDDGDDGDGILSTSEGSSDYGSEDEWQGIGEEENDLDDEEEEAEAEAEAEAEEVQVPQEKTNVTSSAYVPPHLRNAQRSADSELIQKLSRQLKGLLNRLSEQNISSLLDNFEGVYRDHRRNDVTTTLTTLIISGISSHSSLLDSYVVLHAALVASLHKVIGIEFAAHFVQTTVVTYEDQFQKVATTNAASTEDDGKECSNLIVLLSELYNFQVISSVLVFDIIRSLLAEDLTEFTVELLLKIVRNSGQQLRQDDPSALKDIIEIVQKKISTKDDAVSSRTRFMVETLTNLKNNKLKRNVTQNQGGASVERMKKFLSGLNKTKHVLSHEPLRVSLADLHSAETKGKWWIVGAAWGGDPLIDKQDEFVAKKKSKTVSDEEPVNNGSVDLLKLARAQGMNSDIRRGIFVVLMSSDDYLDACERLSQLNLTEVQQREIIRVILHCCGNERSYNPYYTLVCQQLCHNSHSYKITLQFSLWDFLRDLGETTVGGAAVIKNIKEDNGFDVKDISQTRLQNVAKAYAWWIAKDCVTLLILKPVDFTLLKPQTQTFLKELFIQVFINSQRSTPLLTSDYTKVTFTRNRNAVEEIFIKASRVQALAMGIVYFLSESFKTKSSSDDEYTKFMRWAVGIAKETLRTGVDLIPAL